MLVPSIFMGRNSITGIANPTVGQFYSLKRVVEEEKLKPVIDRIYTLEEIVKAHEYVGCEHKKGNVVIFVEQNC